MPNWCDNSVRIWSKPNAEFDEAIADMISEFEQNPNSSRIAFDFLVPVPVNIENGDEASYRAWVEANWGSKKDDSFNVVEKYNDGTYNVIYFGFLSAWGPPIEWYKSIVDRYPDAEISIYASYYEPGMAFCGVYSTDTDDLMYDLRSVLDPDAANELIDVYQFRPEWVEDIKANMAEMDED